MDTVVLCLFRRMPSRSCGCVRRSRSWWGRRCRSSPGRWRARRGPWCRRTWRRRSSPSGRDGSPPPWCCRRSPGRRRNQLLRRRCSAVKTEELCVKALLLRPWKPEQVYLQCPTDLHDIRLSHHGHAEVSGLHQLFQDGPISFVFAPWVHT